MKALIKKLIPQSLLQNYHKFLAVLANIIYGRPSEKMIVIGVTGTNGKSTTAILIGKILEEAGYKVGITSTAIFKVADKEWLNDKKMTMLGRFALQGLLRRMVKAGCSYAVIETSSEGIRQFRHLGIHYDVCVFTNLAPEHIESHGSFENYKKAKLKLFAKLETDNHKTLHNREIKKVIVANADDEHAKDFLDFKVDERKAYGLGENQLLGNMPYLRAENISYHHDGTKFMVQGNDFDLKLLGKFNIYNSLSAISVALSQGIDMETCQKSLEKVTNMPGRMEFVEEAKDFKVLVDYAPEPDSMTKMFENLKLHSVVSAGSKIIHVLGSCGGGRDTSRRPVLGQISAQNADYLVITNEDPYDDNPRLIIDQVASGGLSSGKVLGENLFKIEDRREAIKFALSLAKKGDLVLLTGKGCEQAICVANGKKIAWDEREVVRELLKNQ
ncbi:MAG: UDP-N-acetylmuramoyl-L-alanyl-D-glutamate--2,6-diaminopimelate ligase [Patescibacteria group bacterium]